MRPASFLKRFLAWIVDNIVFGALTTFIAALLMGLLPKVTGAIIYLLAFIPMYHFYYVVPLCKTGQTVGKKALGLIVIFEDEDFPVRMIVVCIREYLGRALSGLFILGYLWPLFNAEKKAWHDLIAKSQVMEMQKEEEISSRFKWKWVPALALPIFLFGFIYALLYTSFPLNSIRENMELSGIEVDSLEGSLAGGLEFGGLRGNTELADFNLKSARIQVDFKDLLFHNKVHVVDFSAADLEIQLKVPEEVSAQIGIPSFAEPKNSGKKKSMALVIDLVSLKNIKIVRRGETQWDLKNLQIQRLKAQNNKMEIDNFKVAVSGFEADMRDFKGDLETQKFDLKLNGIADSQGLPMLKKDLKLNLKLQLQGSSLEKAEIIGDLFDGKASFEVSGSKKNMKVLIKKLKVPDYFQVKAPLEEVDFNLTSASGSSHVDASVGFCGNKFSWSAPHRGFAFDRNGKTYLLRFAPLSSLPFTKDFRKVLNEWTSLDAILKTSLIAGSAGQDFVGGMEVVSDLCYGKPVAQLLPEEFSRLEGMGLVTESSKVTPQVFEQKVELARSLFMSGQYPESAAILHGLELPPGISEEKKIDFLRLQAWVALYSGDPGTSAALFSALFLSTKQVGDAEGAIRSYEKTHDINKMKQFEKVLGIMIAQNPALTNNLSPNMRRRMASENR